MTGNLKFVTLNGYVVSTVDTSIIMPFWLSPLGTIKTIVGISQYFSRCKNMPVATFKTYTDVEKHWVLSNTKTKN